MIEIPSVVGDVVRSVGLSTAMRAAGVVTGLLPIPQPMLLVGPGSSARLGRAIAAFGHRKVMIVTDKVVAGMGLLDGLVGALAEGGTRYAVFDEITPDAPIPLIEQGIAFYAKQRCEAIVAFGGGSPMDAAKAIALSVANKKHPRKLVGYFRGLRAPVPVYAVPTTAATAAAYYRNSCVHFFVPSAIAELALQHVAGLDGCEPLAAFRAEALRVRDLLKFEFFFDDKEAFLHSMESQLSQRAPEWRDHLASPHEIGELLESLDPLLAPGTLRPFVEAYWVLADALLREDPAQPLAPKPFLKRCVALGQQRVRQRRVASEESASRAYFEPALKLAENRGLLTGDAVELQAGRKRFAAELAGLVARIDRLALLAERRRTAQDPYAPGNAP